MSSVNRNFLAKKMKDLTNEGKKTKVISLSHVCILNTAISHKSRTSVVVGKIHDSVKNVGLHRVASVLSDSVTSPKGKHTAHRQL